ncbi:MAG: redox-regulated ATPase YchF [Acidimicrobiia bacterium]|nr:redox-regulated ATPase YchF [Acidimicrobiia bacterium]
MTRAGLLGYPNVGKTTLFNALTGLEAFTAPHPYTTTQPRVGTVKMQDRTLDRLAALEQSRKVTHAGLDLVDLPAVRSGSIRGLGAGREPDLLLAVLRTHASEAVPVDEHGTDPVGQADDLLMEMALSDFEMFERRNERLTKEAAADPRLRPVAEAVTRAAERLGEGIPLRQAALSDIELRAFRDMAPLSLLPCVWVVNVADDDDGTGMAVERVREAVPSTDPVLAVSALIEEEVAGLEASQRAEVYEGLGLGEGAPARVVRTVYDALGLVTFYTVNRRDARAWTVHAGTGARDAAGRIHSDMERGFIRAEVATIREVIRSGGWARARADGSVRVEGRDYEVRDGDVMMVRFSV